MLFITRNVIYRSKINATETTITVSKVNQTKFVLWEKQKIDKLIKRKEKRKPEFNKMKVTMDFNEIQKIIRGGLENLNQKKIKK